MIEKKLLERCVGMLSREKVISYLCLMLTDDNKTTFDFTASVFDMSLMMANMAVKNPDFGSALSLAYVAVEHYLSGLSAMNESEKVE